MREIDKALFDAWIEEESEEANFFMEKEMRAEDEALFDVKTVEEIEEAIKKGADVNTYALFRGSLYKGDMLDYHIITPLYLAATSGNVEVSKALIEAGADVNASCYESGFIHFYTESYKDITPLYLVVASGNVEMVKALIEAGADVNALCTYKKEYDHDDDFDVCEDIYSRTTPLCLAVANNNTEIAKMLMEAGADANRGENKDGKKALQLALENNNTEVAKALIKAGVDVSVKSRYGDIFAPLSVALKKGNIGVAKMLMEAGADIKGKDNEGKTPLHYAAERGNVEMVKALRKAGAHVDVWDDKGRMPLHYAAKNGNVKVAEILLIRAECYINEKDDADKTPLQYAAENGNVEMVKVLIKAGAKVEDTAEIFKTLIKAGADVSYNDYEWFKNRARCEKRSFIEETKAAYIKSKNLKNQISGAVVADEIAEKVISGKEKRTITPEVGKKIRQKIMKERCGGKV